MALPDGSAATRRVRCRAAWRPARHHAVRRPIAPPPSAEEVAMASLALRRIRELPASAITSK
eukprot:1167451-Prymnesium_polylepis.1